MKNKKEDRRKRPAKQALKRPDRSPIKLGLARRSWDSRPWWKKLTGILKEPRLPPQSTLWRFLASLHLNVAQTLSVQRAMRQRVWQAANIRLAAITLAKLGGPACCDLADPIVSIIGDEEIAHTVHGHTGWRVETCGGGRIPISPEAKCSVSRNCTDDSARRHLPDPLVSRVSNEEIARTVHCHTAW